MVLTASNFTELKEKEKQARKMLLINSAMSLFSKRPFYEVGLKEVAGEAGVSTATIYRYFSTQEELFFEAFLQNISSLSQDFENIVQKDEPDSVEQFAVKMIEHLFKNEFVFQMIVHMMVRDNLDHSVIEKFNTVTKIFFDLFAQLMERHGMSKTEARKYSRTFVGSIAGIFMAFRLHPLKSKDEIKKYILKLVRCAAGLYPDPNKQQKKR